MTWDWQVFLQDDGSGRTYLEWMLEAWRWTLAVAGASWLPPEKQQLIFTAPSTPRN